MQHTTAHTNLRHPGSLIGAMLPVFTLVLAGCATDAPPSAAEIREQSGMGKLELSAPWRAGAATGAIADNWLATFEDSTLDSLVAEAVANNPDLRTASIRVEQAGQYIELAKAAMRPSINLFGTGGLNMGGGDVSSALQGVALSASWEPDLWGRMRYGQSAAEATEASARADREFSRQSLAAAVARGWFVATETLLQVQIAGEMVAAGEQLVVLAEKRMQVGPGNEQDIVLARAGLGNFRDSARQFRFAHDQSLRALELLLGRYPGAELKARSDLPSMPGPVPAGLPLEMLERRPDMVAAERRVAAAFNRVGEAKAARLPRIILNASIAAIDSTVLQLKNDFSNPIGGAGAKLVAPIYTGGALETQVEIRTLEQKEAVAQYAGMALRALGDVEGALSASQTIEDRLTVLQQVLADNKRALAIAQTQYRIGKADMRAVQQQQLAVSNSNLSFLRLRSEQLSQRAGLHLALGGSFAQPAKPAEPIAAASLPAPQN